MSEDIRRLQNSYNLENYPYADSSSNRKKLHQLGLLFGQAAPASPAEPESPPAEVITLPATPQKVSWVAKNKKLILVAVVVAIVICLANQR